MNKISVQVSFWRFKWMTNNLEKNWAKKYGKLCLVLAKKEEKEDTIGERKFFTRLKQRITNSKMLHMCKLMDQFSQILETKISRNISEIVRDADLFANSDMMMKIKNALFGKYRQALQKLRDHNFRMKMTETLDEATLKRLLDRLMKGMMNSQVNLKRQTYDKLRKHMLLENRRKGVIKRMLDSGFRLMAAAFNKLVQDSRARAQALENKLKFLINSLRDKDSKYVMLAYNEMKRHRNLIVGIGLDDSDKLKKKVIRRIMDKGYHLA